MAPSKNGYLPLSTFDLEQQRESYNAGLSDAQVRFFHQKGYLIIPNALDAGTVQALMSETNQLLDDFSIEDHPMTKFTTGGDDGKKHVGDDYFLTSGNKVRFFFEEDALDDNGKLLKPKNRAVNKIGHYLHEKSPGFKKISMSARNAAIARSLSFKDPQVLQSMVICKQPEIGGTVPPHQDSTFLYTDPPSAVGFWYALEDATVKNGCLSFAPGSHKRCPIRQRFVRQADKAGKATTGFSKNYGSMFPADEGEEWAAMGGDDSDDDEPADTDYVLGEVKAGSLVLIHGNVMHKSEKNTSDKSRFIYTFHVIEGTIGYDERNWLQPPKNGFSRLFAESDKATA